MASVFKKVISEILAFVEQEGQTLQALNKKKYGKAKDPFKIGQ